MTTNISFFPVENGDMTLIKLSSNQTILIDCKIAGNTEDSKDVPAVLTSLKDLLEKTSSGIPFVDIFILSHPDRDHCLGFDKYFHTGSDIATDKDKIWIKEIWSSPIIFERFISKGESLCDDAVSFQTEVKRRVNIFKTKRKSVTDGSRLLIIGKDKENKSDGLEEIVRQPGDIIEKPNEQLCRIQVIGPLPFSEIDTEEETLSKNNSSIILNIHLEPGEDLVDGGKFLCGGDAHVEVWDAIWKRFKNEKEALEFDMLLAPHHCSWHTLSHDSASDPAPEISEAALSAINNPKEGANIIASSKAIKSNDSDPPSQLAKDEYLGILKPVEGLFYCTGDSTDVLTFELLNKGFQLKESDFQKRLEMASVNLGKTSHEHG